MKTPPSKSDQAQFLYPDLKGMLNPKEPLYQLADTIPWQVFEEEFGKFYSPKGRPAKPIRLMVSLLILKHMYDLGDETVLKSWVRDNYFQYFSGKKVFQWHPPIDHTDLHYFRKRIGKKGIEKIFEVSIAIHGKSALEGEVLVDTTVQEKKVTYPTDSKNHIKIIERCRQIAKNHNIKLRQSYLRKTKEHTRNLRFGSHPKTRKRATRARRQLKNYATRLSKELIRNLSAEIIPQYADELMIFQQIINQKKGDKDKIYSLHEPQIYCMSKGKEHKKFEFGTKVSIAATKNSGIIVGAMSFDTNKHDNKTLEKVIDQISSLRKRMPDVIIADRGYRGKSKIGDTKVIIPKPPAKKATQYQKRKARIRFRRRASIEPIIGHLKSDNRMEINYYKGTFGDEINVILASTAFNFKKFMRRVASLFLFLFLKPKLSWNV